MMGNNIQIVPNREIQTKLPKDTLAKIKKVTKPYGGKKALAVAAGCSPKTVFAILKHKKGSPSIIAKLLAGLEELSNQNSAA